MNGSPPVHWAWPAKGNANAKINTQSKDLKVGGGNTWFSYGR